MVKPNLMAINIELSYFNGHKNKINYIFMAIKICSMIILIIMAMNYW